MALRRLVARCVLAAVVCALVGPSASSAERRTADENYMLHASPPAHVQVNARARAGYDEPIQVNGFTVQKGMEVCVKSVSAGTWFPSRVIATHIEGAEKLVQIHYNSPPPGVQEKTNEDEPAPHNKWHKVLDVAGAEKDLIKESCVEDEAAPMFDEPLFNDEPIEVNGFTVQKGMEVCAKSVKAGKWFVSRVIATHAEGAEELVLIHYDSPPPGAEEQTLENEPAPNNKWHDYLDVAGADKDFIKESCDEALLQTREGRAVKSSQRMWLDRAVRPSSP